MFFRKCKKCGGKLGLVDANIEVDIGGKTQKVKKCSCKTMYGMQESCCE